MSESSDVETVPAVAADPKSEARARRRRTWRWGGSSVRPWNWGMAGWAILALGVGVLAGATAVQFLGGEAGSLLSTIALWVAMALPVVIAFRRSVPRGLLRFRAVDLLFGLALGLLLRLAQGWMQSAAGPQPFPTLLTFNGQLPNGWWFTELLAPVVIAPVIEEFFFHALVLVAVFTSVRRASKDKVVAGLVAVLLSTGLFVLAHAVIAPLAWHGAVALLLVGLVNGLLVVLTGRIWPAVVSHAVFNGSYVVLALIGTLAA